MTTPQGLAFPGESVRLSQVCPGLRCCVVTDDAGMAAIRPEWEALQRDCPDATLASSYAWWLAGLRTMGRGARPYVVLLRDAEHRLAAVFPMLEEGERRNPLRVKTLRSFGVSMGLMPHSLIEEPTCLVRPGAIQDALHQLRRHLIENARRWDVVSFRFTHPDAPAIAQQIRAEQTPAFLGFINVVWGVDMAPLAADWGLVKKSLSRSMRDNLPYYPKLLTRHGHDWSVDIVRDANEVRELVPTLIDLHRSRAQSKLLHPHFNYFKGENEKAFIQRVLEDSSSDGAACLGVLRVGGEIVAIQAFLEFRDSIVVWYSGFREEFSAYSPIFVIQTEVFKAAVERNIRTVNFLRTHRHWTARWGAHSEKDTLDVMMARTHPLSLLRLGAHCLRWQAQQKWKDVIHRHDASRRAKRTAAGKKA